jgi:hypothetical protein
METKTSNENQDACAGLAATTGSVKYVPFTITVPEVKPGQGVATKEIQVPVRDDEGVEILTIEAHDLIDRIKMQMMLSRLNEAVRELFAANQKLPSSEAKATPTETAGGGIPISPNDKLSDGGHKTL